jgi:predicted HAD superfamily phosphohydrolase
MKLSISEDSTKKLKEMMAKISKLNPYAQQSMSALVEAIAVEFSASYTEAQIECVASRLTTTKGKQKALMTTLKSITLKADDETLKTLEKTLKKINSSAIKNEEKVDSNGVF